MGNMELKELRQYLGDYSVSFLLEARTREGLNMCPCGVWLRPNQSTMDRIRAAMAVLRTPHHCTTVILSRGRKRGHNQWQHHLHPQHGQEAQRGGVLHLGTINGKNGTLKGGKTKYGGTNDNQRQRHDLQTLQYKETCTESQSDKVSAIVTFTCIQPPFVILRTSQSFVLSGERDGGFTENTSPYAHTRTYSRCVRSHARCDHTFGSRV